MNGSAEFMDLVLDDQDLHTPEGAMAISDLTCADFVRDIVRGDAGPDGRETSPAAALGGAAVGGALFGAVGAVGGAIAGSTYKEDVSGTREVESNTVRLVFETATNSYTMDVPRDAEEDAHDFIDKVNKALEEYRG